MNRKPHTDTHDLDTILHTLEESAQRSRGKVLARYISNDSFKEQLNTKEGIELLIECIKILSPKRRVQTFTQLIQKNTLEDVSQNGRAKIFGQIAKLLPLNSAPLIFKDSGYITYLIPSDTAGIKEGTAFQFNLAADGKVSQAIDINGVYKWGTGAQEIVEKYKTTDADSLVRLAHIFERSNHRITGQRQTELPTDYSPSLLSEEQDFSFHKELGILNPTTKATNRPRYRIDVLAIK